MTSPVSVVEKTVNRLADDCEQWLADCITSEKPALQAAWRHQILAKGKRLRLRLALHTSLALGSTEEQCKYLACACELVHQASLIHDDLMDKDVQRNGLSTIWQQFGSETAICLGDALIVEAMFQSNCIPQISATQMHAIATLFRDAIQTAAEGQIADCDAQQLERLSYSDYCAAVRKKSGALLGLPVLAAMVVNNYSSNDILSVNEAFLQLGTVYQLLDDLNDRELDRGKRLNGYWILARTTQQNAETALHEAVQQQLQSAEQLISQHDESINSSFGYIRDAMLTKQNQWAAAS
ncbi:polyprenyl synthetase family protein [Idiomarina seosinensis]|uniref:polyprenyl synthetase family protein n=1 Tax=Idiomarina seosinensis TaxID=281739 RepID=UPI0038510D11